MWQLVFASCHRLTSKNIKNKGRNGTSHGHPVSHFQPIPGSSSYLELFGAIWFFSGAIWSYSELYRAIWSHLEPFGAIWSHLQLFAAILICFEALKVIWSYL